MTSQSLILVLAENFPPRHGGSGRWLWELFRRLPADRSVIAAGIMPGAEAFDSTHDLNVSRIQYADPAKGIVHPKGFRGYWRNFRQLSQLAIGVGATTVHAGCVLPEGFLAYMMSLKLDLPYLVYVHGEEVEGASLGHELNWMVRRVFRRAACLVANTQNTRNILIRDWNVPEHQVTVVHPGVDTEQFQPAPRNAKVRNNLEWGERPVILTVGRLAKRKGLDVMLRAMPAICQSIPNVLYAIVGDGEERDRLMQIVQEENLQDHVRFHGAVDDRTIRNCYQQCDLFVLPNRRVGTDIEGFGMVLLEAQACGQPVLAGASGGTAEAIDPGYTGLTIDCRSSDQLAKPVIELLQNTKQREQMGRAGREWTVVNFDWAALAKHADRVFSGIEPLCKRGSGKRFDANDSGLTP